MQCTNVQMHYFRTLYQNFSYFFKKFMQLQLSLQSYKLIS